MLEPTTKDLEDIKTSFVSAHACDQSSEFRDQGTLVVPSGQVFSPSGLVSIEENRPRLLTIQHLRSED